MLPTHRTLPIPIQNQKIRFPSKTNSRKDNFQPAVSPADPQTGYLSFLCDLLLFCSQLILGIPRYFQLGILKHSPSIPSHIMDRPVSRFPDWILHTYHISAEDRHTSLLVVKMVSYLFVSSIHDALKKGILTGPFISIPNSYRHPSKGKPSCTFQLGIRHILPIQEVLLKEYAMHITPG